MKVLVDSSIWIDHLHRANQGLGALLESGAVCTHPVVLGELACGSIKNRARFLTELLRLTSLREASAANVLRMIETDKLWGRGLGWGDVHLLASCQSQQASLWTRDAILARAAADLKIPRHA